MRSHALAVLLVCATTVAQGPTALPATVGKGPLVYFHIDEGEAGDAVERLFVADLEGKGPAKEVLRVRGEVPFHEVHRMSRGIGPFGLEVLERLDSTHLLIGNQVEPTSLGVLDVQAGRFRALVPSAPSSFVGVHDGEVVHFGSDHDPGHLLATPWREPGPTRQLTDIDFERVEQIHGDVALAVPPGETGIWRIDLVKGGAKLLFRSADGEKELRGRLSPSGHRLAVGSVDAGRGVLRIVDPTSGEVLRQWRDLQITLSHVSSFPSTLELAWNGDDEVITSESRPKSDYEVPFVAVRRRISDGAVLGEAVYAEHETNHNPPPVPAVGKPPVPNFTDASDCTRARLHRRDRKEPLWEGPNDGHGAPFEISPEGAFAVVRQADAAGDRILLFSGDSDAPRLLARGKVTDFWFWLPARE